MITLRHIAASRCPRHPHSLDPTMRILSAVTFSLCLVLGLGSASATTCCTIKPDSPILNRGETICPLTDGFTGSAPDIGAIEKGVALTIPLAFKTFDDE
jgi:hypothetical protein